MTLLPTVSRMSRVLIGTVATLISLSGTVAAAGEAVRYIHTDALGSPVAKSDENGAIVSRAAYEPYGASVGGGTESGLGFAGHVADEKTGLSYMQQRYYDPELAAFLSVDPVSAASDPITMFSRYRYANGNPYAFVDPDGRRACGKNTTCRLLQGENATVVRSGSGGQAERSDGEASKQAEKVTRHANNRTRNLRDTEYPTAGAAARAWFDAVIPVMTEFTSEIGVRIFQGFGKGALLGNSVSDGKMYEISYLTLKGSVSKLGGSYPAIGYAHTHPGTDFFSGEDLQMARTMFSETNRGRSGKLDFEAFVGLSSGKMYGWSVMQNAGKSDENYQYSTP